MRTATITYDNILWIGEDEYPEINSGYYIPGYGECSTDKLSKEEAAEVVGEATIILQLDEFDLDDGKDYVDLICELLESYGCTQQLDYDMYCGEPYVYDYSLPNTRQLTIHLGDEWTDEEFDLIPYVLEFRHAMLMNSAGFNKQLEEDWLSNKAIV